MLNTQIKNTKSGDNRDADDCLGDLPEWLEEFPDDLEDAEVHATAHNSRESDLERLTKVASKSRKHSTVWAFVNSKDFGLFVKFDQIQCDGTCTCALVPRSIVIHVSCLIPCRT